MGLRAGRLDPLQRQAKLPIVAIVEEKDHRVPDRQRNVAHPHVVGPGAFIHNRMPHLGRDAQRGAEAKAVEMVAVFKLDRIQRQIG